MNGTTKSDMRYLRNKKLFRGNFFSEIADAFFPKTVSHEKEFTKTEYLATSDCPSCVFSKDFKDI